MTDALPNVTGIRVEDVLAAMAALLDQIAAALTATGSLTLVAGALVLVGAVAAGQRRRMREAVILKTLGATRAADPRRLAGGVRRAGPGRRPDRRRWSARPRASAWSRYIMHTDWMFLPGTLAATLAGMLSP